MNVKIYNLRLEGRTWAFLLKLEDYGISIEDCSLNNSFSNLKIPGALIANEELEKIISTRIQKYLELCPKEI